MDIRKAIVLGAGLAALGGVASAQEATTQAPAARSSDPREARIQELEARLAEIETQIQDLREGTAADVADVRRIQSDSVQVTLNNGRPQFATTDGQFKVAVRGLFQFDAASYLQDDDRTTAISPDAAEDLSSGANFRRARIGIEGTAFRDWNYALTYEMGGSGTEAAGLQQAWVEYAGWKPWGLTAPVRFRAGAYAVENTLEGATSNTDQLFLERPSAAEIVRSTFGGDGRSAFGVYANGDRLSLSAFVTGGLIGNTGGPYADEQTGAVARIAWLPIASPDYGVHIGANYSTIFQLGDTTVPPAAPVANSLTLSDRPELRVDGTQLVTTGALGAEGARAYGFELGGQWKNLYASSEYLTINVDRSGTTPEAEFNGWYVQGSWIITGEQRRWNATSGGFAGIRPTKPFNASEGDWGAFELAARYSTINLNDNERASPALASTIRGGEQTVSSLGLNWYPNSVVRFLLDFQHVDVDRLSTAVTPVQIGQDYNALSLRTQVSF